MANAIEGFVDIFGANVILVFIFKSLIVKVFEKDNRL